MSVKQRWSPTTTECYEMYLAEIKSRLYQKATIDHYRHRLNNIIRYLDSQSVINIDDLSDKHIRAYIDHLKRAKKSTHTIHTTLAAAKAWLNFLVAAEVISKSPMDDVKLPRLPKLRKRGFSTDDVKALLKVASDRDQVIVYLMIDTAIRAAELCALNVEDVDIVAGAVYVKSGKGQKSRTVFIGIKTRKALIRFWRKHGKPASNEPLFRSETGKHGRLTTSGLLQMCKIIGKRADVSPCSPHRFRRTAAQWSLSNGMDLSAIQHLLGHSSLKVTENYLDTTADDVKRKHEKFGAVDNSGI